MLVVFDFHGTLSLKSGKKLNYLKKILKKYNDNWYLAMKKSNINPYIMMPTLDDVIYFVKKLRNKTHFAIASMLEDEKFMYDMMKYCFESKNEISPFPLESIVSSHTLDTEFKKHDKRPHIKKIIKDLDVSEIILIDDNKNNVSFMNSKGIPSLLVKNYFKVRKNDL